MYTNSANKTIVMSVATSGLAEAQQCYLAKHSSSIFTAHPNYAGSLHVAACVSVTLGNVSETFQSACSLFLCALQ